MSSSTSQYSLSAINNLFIPHEGNTLPDHSKVSSLAKVPGVTEYSVAIFAAVFGTLNGEKNAVEPRLRIYIYLVSPGIYLLYSK